MDFIKQQFDKILLTFLILFFTTVTGLLLIKFPNVDAATLQWIEKSNDLVLGALIGAVTTQAVRQIKDKDKE